MKKISLNQETLEFIFDFENQVVHGAILNKGQLEEEFRKSGYNDSSFNSYDEKAVGKSIWWALKRSGKWEMLKNGLYQKRFKMNLERDEYIKHLSENLYKVLMLKKEVEDKVLKKYYLSSKGIGEDLYYLTMSYFKQKGSYKNKYYMSDFITIKAKEVLEAKYKGERLVYEHMVPKNFYISEISRTTLEGSISVDLIYKLLNKYYYVCTVTESEDKKLPSVKMSDEWDGENPFYRYEKAGIAFLENN